MTQQRTTRWSEPVLHINNFRFLTYYILISESVHLDVTFLYKTHLKDNSVVNKAYITHIQ